MSTTLDARGAFGRRATIPILAVAVLLLVGGSTRAAAEPPPVDLNSASLETILALPVPPEIAEAIYNHRTYRSYFGSVYDLLEVDGVTPEIFATLKPLVATMPPPPQDASIARLSEGYRQVQRYLGQEGSNEGLVDEYLDKMRDPENVNEMDLFDLMSYQNVSPVDATNILKARERLGRFEEPRQLQRSEGLRYWAFRNLRDFVVYSDDDEDGAPRAKVTGYVQTRYHETPLANDDDELGTFALRSVSLQDSQAEADTVRRYRYATGELGNYKPGWLNKVRVNIEGGYTAGMLANREYGEQNLDETLKGYAGVRDRRIGGFRLKSLYFGNYRAAFGLGLVMDNTDYIHYRKTGYGFNKRLLGIHGDLSRSYEYHLTGAAMEGSYGRLHVALFASFDRKDGIINPEDGTLNRYVVMQPRPPVGAYDGRVVMTPNPDIDNFDPDNPSHWIYHDSGLRRDAFRENILGGNLKFMLAPGTYVGVTGYEARYDRGWRPDVEQLVADPTLLEARDSEIGTSYQSVFANSDETVTEYKWRRVLGADAQAVVANVAVQGEYAFVQDPREDLFSSRNPDAYIVNTYAQWENLHLLAIYRDYDLGFDNPYNRAFSNDNRYEMTLLDAPYRLNDDLYAWLESTTPQPKPEKGMFLEARYRISRSLILNGLQFDQWTRKADGADLMRYTIKGEYQPIFNLRFRVRHRYSSRTENDPGDVRTYRNWETRWQLIALLSNYNRFGLTYMTSNVMFPARQRLSYPAEPIPEDFGATSAVGQAGSPAHAFEARYEHNLTPGIKLTFASSMYDGFLWNFEGNEFVLLDGRGFRNWFKVESRVSERLLFQLKVTRDHNLPKTYVDIRRFGTNLDDAGQPTAEPDAPYVPKDDTIVRLQMDYTF